MHFEIHLRQDVRDQLDHLAQQMASWEARPAPANDLQDRIREAVTAFPHCTVCKDLVVCGIDGTGDFPSLTYADSFIYATVASAAVYKAQAGTGLKEVASEIGTTVELTWLPSKDEQRDKELFRSFERLVGIPIEEVIAQSDYRTLKAGSNKLTLSGLVRGLIRPPAHETNNVGIQLRTTAELGACLRLIGTVPKASIILTDGTMALPFVQRESQSLFYEHVRRLVCVRARARNVMVGALSKSHGLRGVEWLERLAAEKLGSKAGIAEHWYLRVPDPAFEGWDFNLDEARRLPPTGAVTYFVRFHRSTPIMRLDIDHGYWTDNIADVDQHKQTRREQEMFSKLDYSGHDQRCFGYPYPIKAAHDRASLTEHERVVLKKQITDSAVRAGMRRSLFRDAALQTGHQ